jgi:hypothetical protein
VCLPVEAGVAEELLDGGTSANIHLVLVTCVVAPLVKGMDPDPAPDPSLFS